MAASEENEGGREASGGGGDVQMAADYGQSDKDRCIMHLQQGMCLHCALSS